MKNKANEILKGVAGVGAVVGGASIVTETDMMYAMELEQREEELEEVEELASASAVESEQTWELASEVATYAVNTASASSEVPHGMDYDTAWNYFSNIHYDAYYKEAYDSLSKWNPLRDFTAKETAKGRITTLTLQYLSAESESEKTSTSKSTSLSDSTSASTLASQVEENAATSTSVSNSESILASDNASTALSESESESE